MPGSAWSFHGKEVPYTPFGYEKTPYGTILWKSLRAGEIIKRLEEKGFAYPYRHLRYDYGSHLFVPMELSAARFFKGDRGKYKKPGKRARMDSLERTLEFAAGW